MLTLAWRNVWRKRGRSLLTITVVALVVILSLVYFGFGGAARNALYGSLTDGTGHLQVRVPDAEEARSFEARLLRDAEAVRATVQDAVPDAQVAPALQVSGLLEGDGRSRGVALTGMDRPGELRTAYAADALVDGRLPEASELDTVALSDGLAQAVGVGLGDNVYAYTPGTLGYGAAAYTVVGLLDPPGAGHVAQTSLAAAQELAAPDAVTRVEVHLPAFTRAAQDAALPGIQADLRAALGDGVEVTSWRDLNGGMAAYLDLVAPMQAVVNGIFFVLAGLLVTNTVYLGVIERVREFGIIRALGARGRRVTGMVLAESLLLCGVGLLAGSAVGLGIVARMAQGFGFPGELGAYLHDLGLPTELYASLAPGQLLLTLGFTLAIGVLAAWLPAATAARMEPIEAIRFTA